jgi:hypothetical protein
MKKTMLLFYFALTSNLKAEVFCRTEPVAANGDDYIVVEKTIEIACEKSLQKCEAHYHNCVVIACGNWDKSKMNFDDPCSIN